MEAGGEVTRIYVGGLGGGVTEDDLRRTFSALGQVTAVDVVRTKGRSFAYLDFLPSSDKSLPKLFSTYNGCTWKGGKLRLEKAKEHYLLRLKREWQEDSEHASKASDSCNADPSESVGTLEKQKKISPADKIQLNIFFPKLGKVKSLASVGIGKHKYSFQRLQVPAIPTHFCDCEEHSVAFVPTSKKQSCELENVSDGINEQELNIMNSVMNRIFEKANPSNQATGKSESVNGNGASVNSRDELDAVENDEEDHLADEDNLIINVATGKSDSMDLSAEMRTMMANREPAANRLITSGGKPKNVQNSREKKSMLLSKKRKSPHLEENDASGNVIPEASSNSHIHLDTKEDSKTEIKSGTKQPGSNSLRSLKSTWKDLIGQKGKIPFSISDIIASVPQAKDEKPKGDDAPKKTKKKKTESDKKELVSSVPETTSHVNKEAIPESVPYILANDPEQKEGEPSADDLDVPLTTIADQFMISDVCKEKENEPAADDDIDVDNIDNLEPTADDDIEVENIETLEPTADDDIDVENIENLEPTAEDDIDVENIENLEPTAEDDIDVENIENLEPTADDDIDVENIDNLEPADKNQSGKCKSAAKHDEDLIRTARGEAWRHKSSWTQLMSNTGHTSFSISQIVPSLSFEKQTDEFDLQPANKNLETCAAETANDQSPVGVVTVKKSSERKRTLSLGDSCPFMRTEASLKQWKKAKASLTTSLNKKKRPLKESA